MDLHITMLYAGVLGLLLTALSFNIMHHWVRVTANGQEGDLAMRRAERGLSHFVEYVPLTLLLMALIELRGAPAGVLHGLGGTLVFARLLHACASNEIKGAGLMRFVGAQLTFLVITLCSLACIAAFAFARL